MCSKDTRAPVPSGRLQRASLTREGYISRFRQVLRRHGLTMATIAAICLLIPSIPSALSNSLNFLLINPSKYLLWTAGLGILIILFLRLTGRELNARQAAWIAYLLMISIVEEVGFRLSLPIILSSGFSASETLWIGVFLSNLIFATIHYLTLRWKLTACVFTFLGGMGFSRLFETTGDLALVILIHWVVTFLNTPSAPREKSLILPGS